MSDNYIDVSSKDFTEKVLNAEPMVLVNFIATGSGASEIQAPEFEALSREYQGRAIFAQLVTDKNKDITNQWHIDGIPTIIFFKSGREIHRIKGIIMRERLRRQLEGVLLAH